MNYGKRLRALREERGLSQDRLAELITSRGHRVSGANLSIIERSYDRTKDGSPTRPNRRIVELAAEILNDDVNAALFDAGYSPITGESESGFYSGFSKLPPDKQRVARRQIKAIIDALAEDDDPDTDYIDE